MRKTILMDSENFRVVSWGGGVSYVLLNKRMGQSVHVQGDDATQFENELEAMENAHPHWDTDRILAEIWEQYELAAEPDRNWGKDEAIVMNTMNFWLVRHGQDLYVLRDKHEEPSQSVVIQGRQGRDLPNRIEALRKANPDWDDDRLLFEIWEDYRPHAPTEDQESSPSRPRP